MEGGNWNAHAYLGVCFVFGIGVEKDVDESVRLHKLQLREKMELL